jgi:hypothetical protein
VPATKLLCFGGDYVTVENVVGHAELARRGLQSSLEGLVESGWMTMADAIGLVPLLMRENAERVLPSPVGYADPVKRPVGIPDTPGLAANTAPANGSS